MGCYPPSLLTAPQPQQQQMLDKLQTFQCLCLVQLLLNTIHNIVVVAPLVVVVVVVVLVVVLILVVVSLL